MAIGCCGLFLFIARQFLCYLLEGSLHILNQLVAVIVVAFGSLGFIIPSPVIPIVFIIWGYFRKEKEGSIKKIKRGNYSLHGFVLTGQYKKILRMTTFCYPSKMSTQKTARESKDLLILFLRSLSRLSALTSTETTWCCGHSKAHCANWQAVLFKIHSILIPWKSHKMYFIFCHIRPLLLSLTRPRSKAQQPFQKSRQKSVLRGQGGLEWNHDFWTFLYMTGLLHSNQI